ncbi:hypothetical protein BW687_010475 [Pseudomonas graminis]|uniref:hypothetical protein n=1 Tax=Pseudomonas graminis TaxID=158627 RepID=UPI00234AD1A0|nr:hypothetical protein [Pseudomonas graminis]MDC6380598.1 hypothetical protein [Pseudomonas graminis]
MKSIFVVVMSMCSGAEGCLDENQPTAYSTRAECMESVALMPTRKGIKYHCSSVPQVLITQQRRTTKNHLVTNAAEASVSP